MDVELAEYLREEKLRIWKRSTPPQFVDVGAPTRRTVDWLGGPGFSLILTGAAGTGKTTEAWAAIRYATFELDVTTAFVTAQDLSSMFLSDRSSLLARLDRDLVVVDDLGAEHDSTWITSNFHNWLDNRWSRQSKTVVTTNLSHPDDLAVRYGKPFESRLLGKSETILFGGVDRRRSSTKTR